MSDQQAGVDSSATTQLADAFPLINTCLRVLPPETMNAPAVAPGMSTDEMIRSTVFSPEAFKKQSAQRSDGEPTSLAKTIAASEKATMSLRRDFTENHADYKNKITDFTTLAFSMKRAGNTEAEAAAYYCQGVTRESMGQFKEAITAYKKFLSLSTGLNDVVGISLAYNVMACNRITLAIPPSLGSPYDSAEELSAEQTALVEEARDLHEKHLSVTDEGGQFVANTNIAICQSLLGDFVSAAKYHQDALRIAIRMQSFSAQSVAVGNLGLLAYKQKDMQTANACLEQHLQLTQSLRCVKGETNAWYLMGLVADAEGEFEKATRFFEEGRRVAEANNMMGMVKRLNCMVGVVQGKMNLVGHLDRLVKRASANHTA
ncbi:hypothetical protein TeGR_g11898 [Tetraparma gracilis]|uniref:Uncharacterized protein n=1 Tax=Tetraparma gracilis TaxID=2962635 RepID=A0ABQ6N3R2_9STRA|nr:hypothetical protein TeGR_g11898 [Tetraparma gracilis]